MKTIKEIREKTGLSQAKFAQKYGIPKRSLEHWEAGDRKCPDYLIPLLEKAVESDAEMEKAYTIYTDAAFMKELGACYYQLLRVINPKSGTPHNPFPDADIFPLKYFNIVFMRAVAIGIPDRLNKRIADMMACIDLDDFTSSFNKPCPMESRMFFNIGMSIS